MAQYGMNSNGHLVPVADTLATIEVDEVGGFAVGDIIYSNGADTAAKYDSNSETACASILGIADNTYADNATASYFRSGDNATGLSGLTTGVEYFADPSTGGLSPYSSIASGEWTRSMGHAISTDELSLKIGAVFQK